MKLGSDSREKISIIIPVYNVENYLVRCIESVLNQTYQNLEIILIDDGSTDSSGVICDQYCEKDRRAKVIHQSNMGLSSARNSGLDAASGTYVTFVDSDDYIETDMYEKMLNCILDSHADICICSRFVENENGEKKSYASNKIKEGILSKKLFFEKAFSYSDFDMAMWDKLYKRELFEEIKFPEGKTQEDYYVSLELIARCRKAYYIPSPFYHYIQRAGSITRNKKISTDGIEASKFAVAFFSEKYPELTYIGKTALAFSYIGIVNKHILNNITLDNYFKVQAQQVVRENLNSVWRNGSISYRKKLQALCFCLNFNTYKTIICKSK